MAKAMIEDKFLSDIADEINIKNGSNRTYQDSELAQAVRDISAIPYKEKGAAGGVATLGADRKVPEAQIPVPFLSFGPGGIRQGRELPFTWQEISEKTKAGDYSGIVIGDYKTITLTTGETVVMEVSGIDTYTKTCDWEVGHHIDWISRDCLRGGKQFNLENDNNGTEAEPNPWRASKLFGDMNTGVFNTLPEDLKAHIIEKRALLEHRYSGSGKLTANNSWGWGSMGKLWLPTEVEVFGCPHWSEKGYGSGVGGANIQYPIFMGGAKHLIKGDGNGGGRCPWWEASAFSGGSADFCYVGYDGAAHGCGASYGEIRVPLCFRIG